MKTLTKQEEVNRAKALLADLKANKLTEDSHLIPVLESLLPIAEAAAFKSDGFPIEGAEVEMVVKVDYNDLDTFITEQYGRDFESIADQEWSNYMDRSFTVEKGDLSDYKQKELENWKAGKYEAYMLRTLLTDLCNRGILPECELLVHIFW